MVEEEGGGGVYKFLQLLPLTDSQEMVRLTSELASTKAHRQLSQLISRLSTEYVSTQGWTQLVCTSSVRDHRAQYCIVKLDQARKRRARARLDRQSTA